MLETEVLAAKDGLNPHQSKREGERWEVMFIKHLLCYQTLLNIFSDHEVTSNMTESQGPKQCARLLIVSISQVYFSLLEYSHTSFLYKMTTSSLTLTSS